MFFSSPYFYYITIGLQIICVIHCIRKGNQGYWIWLIIFLPLIGCIAYLFTEIFTKRELEKVQSGFGTVINPTGRIKKLEANLRFSDTFNNRVLLADAYLEKGFTDKAIELYESSLTGNFTENEYVLSKLILAYFRSKRYEDIIPIGKKLLGLPQFLRSRSHIMYAAALGYTGKNEEAEREFLKMKSKFANYEGRYQFGLFLIRSSRQDDAFQLFTDIVNESSHLSPRERRYNKEWLQLAKTELQKFESSTKAQNVK
ncbi:MAG TPA: hypothetical protein VGQ09_08515 [Chitinophagaceae bacterium]|jgi:hypothetical protein|nr:hypothetical protein [Chitinophagaceae bacterium]